MCGGQSNPNISANCFGYDFATDTWNILGEMPEPKVSSNNAYDVHWGLVMAGGQVQASVSWYQFAWSGMGSYVVNWLCYWFNCPN